MSTYPVSLVLTDKQVIVVGGGCVAARKAESLLETGAHIVLIAPKVTEKISAYAEEGRIELKLKNYEKKDLDGADLVMVATDDEQINLKVFQDANEAHILINIADKPLYCSFFLPSVHRQGKLSLAVSTDGASPVSARKLKDALATHIPSGFEELLELLNAWRATVIEALPSGHARARFWDKATEGEVLECINRNAMDEAEKLLKGYLDEEKHKLEASKENDGRA